MRADYGRSDVPVGVVVSSVAVQNYVDTLTDEEAHLLLYDWESLLGRPDQLEPPGEDWEIWLILAGRGWGKTRTGSEWVRKNVFNKMAGRIALVAETTADARAVMVEGPSGLIATAPKHQRPSYQPSNRKLTWPNGAVAYTYNATEPDQLRGPEHDLAWSDELAKWKYARETWDMLQFGLRIGNRPRQIITTTPRPIPLVKDIVGGSEGPVHATRGRTLDNSENLAPTFLRKIVKRYEGTRLGRQELDGIILGDMPGALWRLADLATYREQARPAMRRVLVSVDHAVSDNEETSNEHGIMVGGIGEDGNGYLLEDASIIGSPDEWANRVVNKYDQYSADSVIVERNQGGDLVRNTLRTVRPNLPIIEVTASRGKHVRAEPIASLSAQGRIRHVGQFEELEDQMILITTSGYQGEGSPDRVDAFVWLFTELFPEAIRPIKTEGSKAFKPRVVV